MKTEVESLDKERYLFYRVNNEQLEILRAYFNYLTQYEVDEENFKVIMGETLKIHPGLQEDLDSIYPAIIKCFDIHFNVCFLTEEIAQELPPQEELPKIRKLIAAF